MAARSKRPAIRYPGASSWTTVPAGTVGSCTSIIAWWNSALKGRSSDSMRVMPWRSRTDCSSRSVACTPTITLRSAGSIASASSGNAESARPRLSATDSMSLANRSMPNLRSRSTSCWARRRTFCASARARRSLSCRSAFSACNCCTSAATPSGLGGISRLGSDVSTGISAGAPPAVGSLAIRLSLVSVVSFGGLHLGTTMAWVNLPRSSLAASDRLQRGMEPGAAHDDAAAVAYRDRAVALGESLGQWPRAGCREPQAQQMAPPLGFGPVHEAGAVVQHRVVVHELHVARLELHEHVQLGIVGQRIEQVERLDMGGRQARGVGEALGGVDVLALVDRGEEALVPAERRNLEIGLLAFRHLAASVGGHRLEQELQQVGPAAVHFVEYRGRAHQRRQAAGLRRLEAQQADDVA